MHGNACILCTSSLLSIFFFAALSRVCCANAPGKGFVLLVGSFISSLEVEGTRYHVNFKRVGCHNLYLIAVITVALPDLSGLYPFDLGNSFKVSSDGRANIFSFVFLVEFNHQTPHPLSLSTQHTVVSTLLRKQSYLTVTILCEIKILYLRELIGVIGITKLDLLSLSHHF